MSDLARYEQLYREWMAAVRNDDPGRVVLATAASMAVAAAVTMDMSREDMLERMARTYDAIANVHRKDMN